MSIILAIDTATGPCSVAVWRDGVVAAYGENVKPAMQSASLLPLVEETMAQSGTTYQQLTHVACTIGPGSFTGIRVGLAAARGVAFAANIPGIGFTTLDVLAFAARRFVTDHQEILALLNAGKGEYYFQSYDLAPHWQPRGVPMLGSMPPLGNTALVAGNIASAQSSPITFPRADALAELAASYPALAQAEFKPFYIRGPDAKLPGGREIPLCN